MLTLNCRNFIEISHRGTIGNSTLASTQLKQLSRFKYMPLDFVELIVSCTKKSKKIVLKIGQQRWPMDSVRPHALFS